jgi:putative peptide zinc metalloprotease protein
MSIQPDYAVRELEQLRLRLRDDLKFTLQSHGGIPCYVVEDPLAGAFYRVGLAEFELMAELDGKQDLAAVLQRTSAELGEDAFTLEEVGAVCRWLLETGLAGTQDSRSAAALLERSTRLRQESFRRKVQPLFLRLPLIQPDSWFRKIAVCAGYGLSWPGMLLWLLIVGTGCFLILTNWGTFRHELARIVLPHHWLWLGATWVVLRLLHESAHGAVCRYYGGEVPEGGLYFILGMPIPYVDVTTSWRFREKRRRIAVAAAGMYVELFIAGIAALLWSSTTPPAWRSLSQYVVLSAGFTTLLFNLNILMRFDGYYILTDWLEIPNLYGRGKQYLGYLYRRLYLGLSATSPLVEQRRAGFVRVYAFAALFWRLTVVLSLLSAAIVYFGQLGWVLVFVTLVLWFVIPGWKAIRSALFGDERQPARPLRFVTITILLAIGVVSGAGLLPWPWGRAFPAVVDYADLQGVRNESAGFVTSVDVKAGQWVTEGSSLVQLENPELVTELENLHLVREQILANRRRDLTQGNLAVYQARANELEVVDHQILLLETRKAALTIRAPRTGRVIATDLDSLVSQYIEPGTELMWLADEQRKELILAAERLEMSDLPDTSWSRAWIWGGPMLELPFPEFEPRATKQLPHPALAAEAGGPLATQASNQIHARETSDPELATPAFRARIALPREYSEQVHAGQRATLWLSERRTVASWIVARWRANLSSIF